MITRRDNLIALLRGERPQWVPCAINFWQWYAHHKKNGTLPPELAGTSDYLDAMKAAGLDVCSRNIDGGVRSSHVACEPEKITEPGPLGPRRTTRFHTPHGTLTHVAEEQTSQSTGYEVEDLVKDWSRDGRAYLWLLEGTRYTWDRQAFARTDARVGDAGVVMVSLPGTPLKRLHIDFGLEHACLFALDEPEAAKTCCDLYWKNVLPLLHQIASDPAVHVGCMMDNVDAPFYSPTLASLYWTPYVREAADIFRSHGKRLMVHACGHLKHLMGVFRESGVHGLEGMAHPPLGDFTPSDARAMPEHFIYNGGFSAHEQVTRSDDEVCAFYNAYFRELDGLPRFIFASACQTTITTPWARIRLAIDLCRQHGGAPETSSTCAGTATNI